MNPPNLDICFVFDLAGVLLEWDPDAVYSKLLKQSGKSQEEFFDRVMTNKVQADISAGASIDQTLQSLVAQFPFWENEIQAWDEQWNQMLVGQIEGTVSAFEELKERGHRVYALGNWSREEFSRALPRFSFLKRFDEVLLSGDCGILKPDPGIYSLAEQRFDLIPENTIFIDDRDHNVHAAIARGWNGIVFENPRHLYLTLMEYQLL